MKPTVAPFPSARLRRTRQSGAVRALVREHSLSPDDLIWPVFVREGEGIEEPVASMPGVMRRSVDLIGQAAPFHIIDQAEKIITKFNLQPVNMQAI